MKLLELVMGMFLLTLFMMVIGTYTKAASNMSQDARANDAAYAAAENKFAELGTKIEPTTTGTDTIIVDRKTYIRNWNVIDSGYQKAEVTVVWNTSKGPKTSVFSRGI